MIGRFFKHPITAGVLALYGGLLLIVIFGGILTVACVAAGMEASEALYVCMTGFVEVLFTIVFVIIYKKNNDRKVIGFRKDQLWEGLCLALPVLTYALVNSVIEISVLKKYNLSITPVTVSAVLFSGIAPAVFEEFVLCGIILNGMMERLKQKKNGIYKAIVIPALVASVMQLTHLTEGSIIDTLYQAGYAFIILFFFGAVCLRTRNLWSVMIMHSLIDLSGSIDLLTPMTNPSINTTEMVIVGIIDLLILILSFYLIRPEKYSTICEQWETQVS